MDRGGQGVRIALSPCKKAYGEETHRAVSPEETLARVSAKIPVAGIPGSRI